jgi:hypothetical protein
MSAIGSLQAPVGAYDQGERIDGSLFSVQVRAAHEPPDGQIGNWTVWLADRSGGEYRRLGSSESSEAPLCALCERPTPHGGVAAVAFTKADGSVELHELDTEGNSIHRMTNQN